MWNIQGLFETITCTKYCKLDDNLAISTINKFDIFVSKKHILAQATWKNLSLSGFTWRHFNRPKSGNGRYFDGLLLLIKEPIFNGISIINNLQHDKLWIKLEKNLFNLPGHLCLCFMYASPASSPYTNALNYEIFQELEKDCNQYSSEGDIIIAGDLNARTNLENYFVLDDRDNYSPINLIDYYRFDKPLPRVNKDISQVD